MYCDARYVKSEVDIIPGKYQNGRLALRLVDAKSGEAMSVATVNIPEADLAENEIIVKDWSENEGMLEFLIQNGLAEDTGRTIPTGWVEANVVRMTDKLISICGIKEDKIN